MPFNSAADWEAGLATTPGLFDDVVKTQPVPDTLEGVYYDQSWSTIFWYYCQSEFSTENLSFLIAVDQFSSTGDLNLAREIYDAYVPESAPQQANIDGPNRAYLDGFFGPGGDGECPPDAFDGARNTVWEGLRRDTFERFKKSMTNAQTELANDPDAWWNAESRERS